MAFNRDLGTLGRRASTVFSKIANTESNITNVRSNLLATNTAIRLLVSDRLQVANAVAIYAPKANPITTGLHTHTGRATISTNLLVSGNTSLTGVVANNTLGAANYVLKTNGTTVFWGPATVGNINNYLQVANAAAIYQTRVIERAALANTNLAITNVRNNLLATNTAIRLLDQAKLSVANAVAIYATKASPTTSELFAHTGRATISTNLAVSGNTTVAGLIANNSLGTANYVLKTNGTTTFWGEGHVPPVGKLVKQKITNTIEGNTVFTVAGGYSANQISVFINGIRQVDGSDVLTTSGSTITVVGGAANNDIIDIIGYGPTISATPVIQQFTASNNQTTFSVSGGYTPSQLLVFQNGILLRNASDVTVTSGTDVVLASGATTNDLIDVYGFKSVPWLEPKILGGNAIINGAFDIWQRGTSFSSIAAGGATYTADRWRNASLATTAVFTCTRSTDVPTVALAGRLFNYSMLYDCTTADASIAAGDFFSIVQCVEGFNWSPLAQRTFTLSFWVKATKTGIYCVSFRNTAGDRSYVAEYTVNTTATWEYKTITVPPSPSAGTWDYTTGTGIFVGWALSAGTTFQTTPGAWNTGNFVATVNQVNATDSTANDFRLTGIKLEPGTTATPFDSRPYGLELALCQRYYNTKTIVMSAPFHSYYGGTSAVAPFYDFPVPMRSAPILSITNAGVEYYSYAGVWTASTLVNWSTSIFGVQVSCPSDGDGRGKLMRSGTGGADPNPILVFNAEL